MREVYFDNAATTRCLDEAADAVRKYLLESYANPSSVHKMGFEAKKPVEECRQAILELLEINEPRRVIFTSGATESVNLAIKGTVYKYAHPENTNVVTTEIEHPCVTNTVNWLEMLNVKPRFITVDENGVINLDSLREQVDENTKILSIIYVNNEFGTVQDIEKIISEARKINENILIHVDATQAMGNIHPKLRDADMISVSAHKFHGPKGVGALIAKPNLTFVPVLHGGGQQGGIRSGTVNAPLIAGMSVACRKAHENLDENIKTLEKLNEYARRRLKEAFDFVRFNTPSDAVTSPHILNISFPGFKGEVLLHMLEEYGIAVSVSSACSSRNSQVGSVLERLNKSREEITGTIRLSFSHLNTTDEIDYFIEKTEASIRRLRLLGKMR